MRLIGTKFFVSETQLEILNATQSRGICRLATQPHPRLLAQQQLQQMQWVLQAQTASWLSVNLYLYTRHISG